MTDKIKELKKVIANAGIILVVVIMPLFLTRNGYGRIADDKYSFFRNVTFFLMGLFAIISLVGIIANIFKYKKEFFNKTREEFEGLVKRLNIADKFFIIFMITTAFSFVLSLYKQITFWGAPDWHMGFATYLFIAFYYYVLRRYYETNYFVIFATSVSFLLVFGLGILNRYGIDPLKLYDFYEYQSWQMRNLLTTIGNINWFSCFASVAAPVIFYMFFSNKGLLRLPYFVISCVTFFCCFECGSEAIYIMFGITYYILFLASVGSTRKFINFIELLMLLPAFWLVLYYFPNHFIFNLDFQRISDALRREEWLYVLIPLAVIWLILRIVYYGFKKDILRNKYVSRVMFFGILIISAVLVILFIVLQFSDPLWNAFGNVEFLRFSRDWGTNRGGIWIDSVKIFFQGNIFTYLFGTGPDTYAYYFHPNVVDTGIFANAVLRNAHNEFLNMFCNEGILGGLSYAGFYISAFIIGFKKFRTNKNALLLCLITASYFGVHFVMFGQPLSTPIAIIFIALLLKQCDNVKDKNKVKE